MKWKEFLKPTALKIILTVFFAYILGYLLLILNTILFTSPNSDCLGCDSPEILNQIAVFFLPLGLGVLNLIEENFWLLPEGIIGSILFLCFILLHALFWYAISCFIELAYNKFKGVKK
ncbi:hypothetical protein KKG83_05260 [Candidatus Micrarchaeota archaeon]|nr:hypothetical protein [Candidatus Micrarchaeota archaeon]MBU2476852.1 hypothetical protein [Candidatus Micrarchaeota archaeon]